MAAKQTIAELLVEIGVDSKDAEKAADRIKDKLKKVEKAGDDAGDGVDKSNKALEKFSKVGDGASKVANTIAAALVGVATTVGLVAKEVLTVGGRFEGLRAQLKTTTGSAEGAAKAFKFIQDFASSTPFSVEELTEAFVKLNNFGIEPTKEVLTSLGDFASSFGKSFNDIIEAVTDATTGEFERLKEFGIKTSSQGDRVKLTFRGVTTEIGKNSKEIQGFLTNLAEENFGGAMAAQALTAQGMMSNLADTWSTFLDTVANLGPLDEFKLLLDDLSEAAGGRGGLAKALARVLTKAIRGVRRLLKGNLIPTLERLLAIVEFVINNIQLLAAAFVAGKLISGVAGLASALGGLGLSITALTGPIGIAIAAIGALGLAAVVVTRQINAIPKIPKAPGPTVDDALLTLAPENAPKILAAQQQLQALRRKVAKHPSLDTSVTRSQEVGLLERIDRLQDAAIKEESDRANKSSAELIADSERQFNALKEVRAAITLEDDQSETLGFLGVQQQSDLDLAGDVIAGGGSAVDALTAIGEADVARQQAAGKLKPGKKGKRKKKKKPKEEKVAIRPPTTVSEFFGAAARGELGTIADRTPSVKDIEPTVAVDITNNNFAFRDTFNISGTADPTATGKSVIKQIKAEFDKRLKNAGQTLATNMVR